jgi:GDP-D-mannose dehydratase
MLYNIMSVINVCRLCKGKDINIVIDLGKQYITSRFPTYGDFSTPSTNVSLCFCKDCGLLQLYQIIDSSELYEHEYGYRSGLNFTMRNHLKQYNEEILSKINLNDNDFIVDIGSNDATMLKYYSSKYKRIGVDPTGKQFKEYYEDIELIPTYFTFDTFRNVYPVIRPKIVSSICMFYDLPNPVQFAKDIYNILDEDGIWTCEQSYLPSMLKTNSIDTICHEHIEYYALHQVKNIADRSGFKIIDIKFNESNGGSFRIYFAKQSSNLHEECTELINKILQEENDINIMSEDTYINFEKDCRNQIKKLVEFLQTLRHNNKKVYIYGASTKGNCLLQMGNINESLVEYAVERNLNKIGKMTSTGVKIISEEEMRKNPPDYMLVLPWHFKKEMIEREDEYLTNGGKFIFPLPTFEIVDKKPKLLLTGSSGFIASYFKDQYNDKYNIYKFYCNERDQYATNLCEYIKSLKPDIVVHLAGISSSVYAFNNPIETLEANGMNVAKICETIYKNNLKCKLFNASSSEIFKGNKQMIIEDNSNNYNHLHPYSIAKIMSHQIVDFYRQTYNLPFSNGIIFSTVSERKGDNFLLNKIVSHAKKWCNDSVSLTVNNLNSYRQLIHPEDVANAIDTIIKQPIGNNYVISNTEDSVLIINLVCEIYKIYGLDPIVNSNKIIDGKTQKTILEIKESKDGLDTDIIDIKGNPINLLKLNWRPKYTIKDILSNLIL